MVLEEKRTLIETFLPVEEISAEAKKEKNGRAPTFELHYWWTRKPLIAARATVLSALLPEDFDITEFKRLLGLRDDQKKRAYNYDLSKSQKDNLKKEYKKLWGTKTPTILDPFAGGGSIPFEAVRMGCNTIANDYNPVSCFILKTTLEYPAKYGNKLLKDVEIGLNWLYEKSKEELEDLYPKHDGKDVAAYIYSWVVECPECGFKNPLVGQWWLVRVGKKRLYLDYNIDNNELIFSIKNDERVPKSNISQGKGKCLNCGVAIPKDHIKKEIFEKDDEKLLAVVLLSKNGKEYDLPNLEDLNGLKKVKELLNETEDFLIKEDLIPTEEMPEDLRGGIWAKLYLKYWHKLLNPRQKILFATLIKLIRDYSEELNKKEDKEYVLAVSTYLTLVLGKHLNRNCRSTKYDRTREGISGTTSLRGIPMLWDHTETNPFIKFSGSLRGINKSILKSLKFSLEKISIGNIEINNESIIESNFKASVIVTDPPYFDDVQYAELSEFFYVFEKRALKNIINLPQETPKAEDLSVGGKRPKEVFENLFELSCKKMNSILADDGLLVMYFAHSSVDAWDFVINALMGSKFRITSTWPIHTENPNNPLSQGHASILSSIVIVARKRLEDKIGFIEEIEDDVEVYLKTNLRQYWNYGLRGADITVAAMGAILDILTQYSEIKSYTGKMTITDILERVEVYVVEYILEKFLKNSQSLDSLTRFYLYCRLSELDGMSFDTANLISKSLNIDLKLLESAGIITSIKTGRNKGIKIQKFNEREHIEVKSLIDAVQWSMSAYDMGGMREFESVLSNIPYSQSDVYNILESFQHLKSGDPEKQISLLILGKSSDLIPKKGQSTLNIKK